MVLIFGCQQIIFLLHIETVGRKPITFLWKYNWIFLELVFTFINLKKNAVFFPFFKDGTLYARITKY